LQELAKKKKNLGVIVVTLCSGKEKTIRKMSVTFVTVVLELTTKKKKPKQQVQLVVLVL